MIQNDTATTGTRNHLESIVLKPMSMALTITGSRTNAAVVLQVIGSLDGGTAKEFEYTCYQWIGPRDRNLILDFGELQYISSAGLGSILGVGKEIDRREGQLVISRGSARLKQTFVMSGFDTLFPLFETTEAALTSCTDKP